MKVISNASVTFSIVARNGSDPLLAVGICLMEGFLILVRSLLSTCFEDETCFLADYRSGVTFGRVV